MGNLFSGGNGAGSNSQNAAEQLRQEANLLYQKRNLCYQQSQDAYRAGNHAAAKAMSQQAKQYEAKAKQANKDAADAIFALKNGSRQDGMIDLHGLYVKEAVDLAERHIREAKSNGQRSLVFVVGRGLHSSDGVAKIAPAVQQLVERHNLRCIPDSPNVGCLTVQFVSEAERGWLGGLLPPGCAIM